MSGGGASSLEHSHRLVLCLCFRPILGYETAQAEFWKKPAAPKVSPHLASVSFFLFSFSFYYVLHHLSPFFVFLLCRERARERKRKHCGGGSHLTTPTFQI
jgi:hypothetical protein